MDNSRNETANCRTDYYMPKVSLVICIHHRVVIAIHKEVLVIQTICGQHGGRPNHDVTFEHIREIYEWTSRKSLELPVFKYEEKIISAS